MNVDLEIPKSQPCFVQLPAAQVLRHVIDVHCHPTDSPISRKSMEDLPITICAMSTKASDQELVHGLAGAHPDKVIPCFGYHPWFTHWVSLRPVKSKEQHYRDLFLSSNDSTNSKDLESAFAQLLPNLPTPTALSQLLATLRSNLIAHPSALLGEVGLDRASRIPQSYPSSPLVLTPFTISITHQLAILEAQLELAVELGRSVSIHSVKAQMVTKDLIERMKAKWGERWENINVDLHSCGLSPQMWRDIEKKHPNVFLSLSTAVNSRSPNHRALISACSPSRILVESDYHDIDQCAQRTWEMVLIVAEVKGWQVEESWDYDENSEQDKDSEAWGVVRRLEENWKAFKKGGHRSQDTTKKGRRRKQRLLEPDSDGSSEP